MEWGAIPQQSCCRDDLVFPLYATDENREGGEKCLKSQSEYMPISNQIRSQVMAFG